MPASKLVNNADISAYPFIASAERASAIRKNYGQIKVGMSAAEVRGILGAPDEIQDRFEAKIAQPRLIGHTYWYVLQRLSATGSEAEKQESYVRISLNLHGQVTDIDAALLP